jgi:hypothetical protein
MVSRKRKVTSTTLRWGILLATLSLPAAAFAQFGLLAQKNGAAAGDKLGWSVSGAGDVNGDGVPDYIVGSPYIDPAGLATAGAATVYSGANGSALYQFEGTVMGEGLGYWTAGAGDVNGDNRADFIIASQLRAFVYSGANGSLLYNKSAGGPVAGAGDVNGDGKDDFLISNGSQTTVYSGANGAVIYQKAGGTAVDGIGDVNGDGKDDFIVSDQYADFSGYNAGAAFVYSGSTGDLLYQKNGAAGSDLFGCAVSGLGDVNGDGRPDFIVGARLADDGSQLSTGAAYVYSGANGSLLYEKKGNASTQWGSSVSGAGDANGDGVADFMVTSLYSSPNGVAGAGSVYLFSGTTGALLDQFDGTFDYESFGYRISAVGDVNGNNKSDFIIGGPSADPGGLLNSGSAYIYGDGGSGSDPCNPDIIAPVLTSPADKRISCEGTLTFDDPTVTDNCDPSPVVEVLSTTENPGPGDGEVTYTRTWQARDASGNVSASASQDVIRDACYDPCNPDTVAPVLTAADDKRITCEGVVEFDNPTVTDNCDASPTVEVLSTTENAGPGDGEITYTRTWQATDASNNVSDPASQSIVREACDDPCNPDTVAPVLTVQDDKRIACDGIVAFDNPTVSDNCDASPTVEVLSTTENPGPGEGEITYTRTWQASDVSGNVSDPASQSIIREACAEPASNFSRIVVDDATCASFTDGSATDLRSFCYSVDRKDQIFKLDSRGFYYYVAVIAPSPTFTVDIVQSNDNADVPLFQVARHGITQYENCQPIGDGTSPAQGQASVRINGASTGQEIVIGVEYSTRTLTGTPVGANPPMVNYHFSARIDGIEVTSDSDGLEVYNCSGNLSRKQAPVDYELGNNYPNPFNPNTQIEFILIEPSKVDLAVYNLLGQRIATLAEGYHDAGSYVVEWDASSAASGVYFYRLETESGSVTKKMTLLK